MQLKGSGKPKPFASVQWDSSGLMKRGDQNCVEKVHCEGVVSQGNGSCPALT